MFMDPFGHEAENIHVGKNHPPNMRPLNLYYYWKVLLFQHRLVDLCQRSGRNGARFEGRKNLIELFPQPPLNYRLDLGKIHRGYIVLELSQLGKKGRGHEIGSHAGDLAELDKGRAQILQNAPDPLPGTQVFFNPDNPFENHSPGQMEALYDFVKTVPEENGYDFLESLEISD